MTIEVDRTRQAGYLRKIWLDCVEEDVKSLSLSRQL